MPDPVTPPTPPPQKKKREALPAFNKAQTEALTKADQICNAASESPYDTALDAREISAAFIAQLRTDVAACRNTASDALQATTSKEGNTLDEAEAKKTLLAAIVEIQKAAKQKYAASQPVILQDYFIGTRIDASRDVLEQTALSIINKLGTDTLPGITTAKKNALTAARNNYIATNTDQSEGQDAASTLRDTRDAQIKSINERRRQIQFAADAEWPHTDKANGSARRRFFLPADRAYAG